MGDLVSATERGFLRVERKITSQLGGKDGGFPKSWGLKSPLMSASCTFYVPISCQLKHLTSIKISLHVYAGKF